MPKTLKMMMARLMNAAAEGADLPGDTVVLDDEHQPGSPEDRGDFLPGDDLDPEALEAVAAGAGGNGGEQPPAQQASTTTEDPDEGKGGNNSGSVPHARFHEVNERRKAAEQELELLRKQLQERDAQAGDGSDGKEKPGQSKEKQAPAATVFDVDAQEQAYLDALMEGDTAQAKKIRTGINQHLMEQASATALERARAESAARELADAQKNATQLLAETANAVVADFPFLEEAEHSEVLDMIEARRDALIAKGKAPHQALREAADFIAPKFAPAGFAPAKSSPAAPAKTDLRPAAATARGAQASLAQPPVPAAGMGNRATGSDPLNVAAMDDEQFDRLSEAEKRRLRGD